MNVLIVEDDKRLAGILDQALTEEGHRTFLCYRGDEASDLISSGHFDVVVLDVMLPGRDGISVVQAVRKEKCVVPILLLTARDSMPEIVRGLDAGADDYLTKPFHLEVLSARVRALARRGHSPLKIEIAFNNLTLDPNQCIVRRDGQVVPLTRREYQLLELLMRRPEHVVTRAQIIEAGWGYDADVRDNNIDYYIHSLRTKIDSGNGESLIRTVRSIGYSLNPVS